MLYFYTLLLKYVSDAAPDAFSRFSVPLFHPIHYTSALPLLNKSFFSFLFLQVRHDTLAPTGGIQDLETDHLFLPTQEEKHDQKQTDKQMNT